MTSNRSNLQDHPVLVKGRLYSFFGRNFKLGVYDGSGGFVGVRRKLAATFLETELHWDLGGTVHSVQDTQIDSPFEPREDSDELLAWLQLQAQPDRE